MRACPWRSSSLAPAIPLSASTWTPPKSNTSVEVAVPSQMWPTPKFSRWSPMAAGGEHRSGHPGHRRRGGHLRADAADGEWRTRSALRPCGRLHARRAPSPGHVDRAPEHLRAGHDQPAACAIARAGQRSAPVMISSWCSPPSESIPAISNSRSRTRPRLWADSPRVHASWRAFCTRHASTKWCR